MASSILLNNVDHRDLRVAVGHHARYGDAINQTRVFPAEFEELQRDYAILLRRDEHGALFATVLLGLDPDENLFLDGDTLARLHRDDFLRPAFWIASSLGNLRHLIDRKLRNELHG